MSDTSNLTNNKNKTVINPQDNIENTFSYPKEISSLPIAPYLDKIATTLKSSQSHFLVLTAETAAGKSTAVPLALLNHFDKKILMLEPRRLAVVAIANRVSNLLGEETGNTAGYTLHLESKISSRTRFEVITEAILTRRLQNDPSLEDVSVVVIDEFHERSIHADLSLAFLKETMQIRDDLYVIVMSATIDTGAVSTYLGDCPVMHVPGRQYPVTIDYQSEVTPAQAVFNELASNHSLLLNTSIINKHSLANDRSENSKSLQNQTNSANSILVFLPGISDINKCRKELDNLLLVSPIKADIHILHSSIPFDEQKVVLSPPKQLSSSANTNIPRVILSSSIAETSLTVPGVTTVIDSGLARINRFDSKNGMEKLTTEHESVFSAEQRAGRAGRTAPGKCIRLWAKNDVRVSRIPPEIMRTDLVPLVLECAQWGAFLPEKLSWLDAPPLSLWKTSQDLLVSLGCITNEGHITQLGKAALSLGLHPRLACVALEGAKRNQTDKAIELVVKYSEYAESSTFRQNAFRKDIAHRLLKTSITQESCTHPLKTSTSANSKANNISTSLLLLAGFPDRLALNTSYSPTKQSQDKCLAPEYKFPSGRIASLTKSTSAQSNTYPLWIIAPEVDAGERTGRIYSYQEINTADAEIWLKDKTTITTETKFDDNSSSAHSDTIQSQAYHSHSPDNFKLKKTELTCYGKLILKEKRLVPSSSDFGEAVCNSVRKNGIKWLPLSTAAQSLLLRSQFYSIHSTNDDKSDISSKLNSLSDKVSDWLLPFLTGGSQTKLTEDTVYNALYWYMNGQTIDRHVPTEITLPNGKKRKICYEKREKQTNDSFNTTVSEIIPVLEIIIQQIFGCFETPKILGVPLLLKLLSPARRPLQITDDLAGFWTNTWPQICKEMKGRYPKHNWDYRISEKE